MSKITLCENTLDPSTWETFENVGDIREFLFTHFNGIWPSSAHIYLEHVSKRSDITPYDEAGIERLGKISGNFYVVVYPEGIELIFLIVAIAVAAVSIAVSFLLRPHVKPPDTASPTSQGSPNNQLAARQNTARPNGRIPDIFGQLWATFDLIAVPYRTFLHNQEMEHCYMCIGRGEYDIATFNSALAIRDDITLLSQISGASAEIYGPNDSPNSGATPLATIGLPIAETVINLQVFGGINGQVLKANPNTFETATYGANHIRFISPNIIEHNVGGLDFRDGFQAGDLLEIGGLTAGDDIATDPGGTHGPVSLAGIYPIFSVSATQIVLDTPAAYNPNWSVLATYSGGVSTFASNQFMANGTFWVGTPPFFLPHPEMTELIMNFVAVQGSYKLDPTTGAQSAVNTTIDVGVSPCDEAGVATGLESLYPVTIIGSKFDKLQKAVTLRIGITPGIGGILLRAKRVTLSDLTQDSVDAVQWRDCYIVSPLVVTDFGDVTTIQTVIPATPQALAVKDRKLNGLVTRKIPVPSGGALAASTNAADIICAMALDPFIGKLQPTDLDITEIYAIAGTGGVVQGYFAMFPDATLPTQFSYTFDDPTISFEESVSDVATSIFCVAYRRGGLLSLSFEQATQDSTLLFNHRNKVPKSETRTVVFGTPTGNDGIDLDYIEPNAPNYPNLDTTVTLKFPPNGTATNPKKVSTIGVRNLQQATALGWRLYLKLVGQNTTVQFEGTEEAALLVLQDRILVADNTRSDSQDGDVIAQSSLLLTLSQDVSFDIRFNYSIFLQHPDATVENIPIMSGPQTNQVILSFAPAVPCITDDNNYAKTTYMIVSDAPVRQNAFLLLEKTPKEGKTFEVKAVNYDDSYYSHDHDFSTSIDVAALVLEVITPGPGPNAEIAALVLEPIQPSAAPNAEVGQLVIEVITH